NATWIIQRLISLIEQITHTLLWPPPVAIIRNKQDIIHNVSYIFVSARAVSLLWVFVISAFRLARVTYPRGCCVSSSCTARAGALVSRSFNMAERSDASEAHVGTSPQCAEETASGLVSNASET